METFFKDMLNMVEAQTISSGEGKVMVMGGAGDEGRVMESSG